MDVVALFKFYNIIIIEVLFLFGYKKFADSANFLTEQIVTRRLLMHINFFITSWGFHVAGVYYLLVMVV